MKNKSRKIGVVIGVDAGISQVGMYDTFSETEYI
jgi:hypothetical protein